MLHNHMASTQAAEAEIRAAFAAMSSRLGLNGGWYRSDHEWGEGLMLRARYSSPSIIGSGARLSKPRTHLSFSEDMIFAFGRPILLLPDEWPAEPIGRAHV